MLFNSSIFAAFIAVLLPVYLLARFSKPRKFVLLVASYLFYADWDYRYLALLFISTAVDFYVGRRMAVAVRATERRLLLFVSLITNLGLLAVFKYGNFILDTGGWIWAALDVSLPRLPETIPVGISFYTFQTLSYTIDIYRGHRKPEESALNFALYVSFFAQLVAGPIVRSSQFLPQIRTMPELKMEPIAAGAQRFLLGLFKKIVIADNVALYVDTVFADPSAHSAPVLWCAAYGFALQIYCDFSGYTDMALGIAQGFGLKLPENFNAPYLSRSITEFWRRWHISLSTWLRDYLYIPLGGSRISQQRTYFNLMVTMLLGGLWHGAAWNFVFWGGFHGAMLAVERARGWRLNDEPSSAIFGASLLRILLTFHLVTIAWVTFRAESFGLMATYLHRMCWAWSVEDPLLNLGLFWAVVAALLACGQYVELRYRLRETVWQRLPAPICGLALASLVIMMSLFHVDDVAFIYFQF